MRVSKLLLTTGLVLGGLSVTGPGHAAVFNVTNGTELQSALTTAQSNGEGDTVNLAAGTYDASGGFFLYEAAENFPISLVGPVGADAVIDGGNTFKGMDMSTNPLFLADANADITVQNLTFQNGSGTGAGGGLQIGTSNADIVVENSVFRDNTDSTGGGLGVNSNESGNITVRKNSFFNNSADTFGGGVQVSNFNDGKIIFDSNLITDNNQADEAGGACLDGDVGNILVTNNIVAGNSSLLNSAGGGGMEVIARTGDATIINNTFFDNESGTVGGGLSIFIDTVGSVGQIYNNIFFNNSATGDGDDIFVFDDAAPTGSTVELFNNDVGDFTTECIVGGGCTASVQEGNNGDFDPLFNDSANGDFNLTAGSQAIGAGDANAPQLPAVDFAGNPRPIGAAPDMGALEAAPGISVDPSSLNFGTVDVGDSNTLIFTVTNNGETTLELEIPVLSDDANYSLDLDAGSSPCNASQGLLDPGASCTASVTFEPEETGSLDATLTIVNNDPDSPTLVVALLGVGNGGSGGGCSLGATAGIGGSWLGMGLVLLSLAFRRRINR